MESRICVIEYRTHSSRIQQEGSQVICFKHNNRSCDFETFHSSETDAIADYIVKPLPDSYWRVALDDDQ